MLQRRIGSGGWYARQAGKVPTNKERREAEKAREASRYTIKKLWEKYREDKPGLKGMHTYKSLYKLHLGPEFGDKEPQDILSLETLPEYQNGSLKSVLRNLCSMLVMMAGLNPEGENGNR